MVLGDFGAGLPIFSDWICSQKISANRRFFFGNSDSNVNPFLPYVPDVGSF